MLRELRMRVVDDLGGDLDRGLGGLPGRGGVAGQRKQHADLHRIGGAREPHAAPPRLVAAAPAPASTVRRLMPRFTIGSPSRRAWRILFFAVARPPLRVHERAG